MSNVLTRIAKRRPVRRAVQSPALRLKLDPAYRRRVRAEQLAQVVAEVVANA